MTKVNYIYNTLIVCSGEKGRLLIKNLLLDSNIKCNISYSQTAGETRRLLANNYYDIVIVNSPLTDEFGDDLVKEICNLSQVMFLIKNELYDNKIQDLLDYDLFTVVKPINKVRFYESLNAVACIVNKIRDTNVEVLKLKEKLEELKFISKAKCLLIEKNHLTEEEAHRYIEKEAMNSRMKKKLVSMEIIKRLS